VTAPAADGTTAVDWAGLFDGLEERLRLLRAAIRDDTELDLPPVELPTEQLPAEHAPRARVLLAALQALETETARRRREVSHALAYAH